MGFSLRTLRGRRLLGASVALGAVAVLTLAACSSSSDSSDSTTTSAAPGQIDIVASTSVWGSIASTVAGSHGAVTSILSGTSADPHSYEATPADAAKLSDAQLIVFNGGGYDQFAEDIVDQHKDKPAVNAFEIHNHGVPAAGAQAPAAEGHEGHDHSEVNEHVWYDTTTAVGVAQAIADQLSAVDADNAGEYQANAKQFASDAGRISAVTSRIADQYPGAKVAQTEPVAHYLLDAAKIEDATPEEFEEAIETESDPSPQVVAQTRDLVQSKAVRALVYNGQTSDRVTEDLRSVAETAGVPVVEVTEGLPDGQNYIDWQVDTANKLASALATSAQ